MGHYGTNVLSVLQRQQKVTLQEASDLAGAHFKTLVDRFEDAKTRLPSYDNELEKVVM